MVLGSSLLHTSWVVTLLRRIATHESAFVRRWGAKELFSIDLHYFPLLQQCGDDFLTHSLVTMLTDTSLYHKQVEGVDELFCSDRCKKEYIHYIVQFSKSSTV